MDRLIAPNSVALANADTAPVSGTPQYATDGNPTGGVPSTQWPAYQYNAFQEEVLAVQGLGTAAPDRTKTNQMATAITAAIATETTRAEAAELAIRQTHIYIPFSTTATITIPPGVYYVWGSIVPGGGGGGGSANEDGGGAGGGGATRIPFGFPVNPGDTVALVAAAGGAPGSSVGPTNGGNGGDAQVFRNGTAIIHVSGATGGAAGNGSASTSPGATGAWSVVAGYNVNVKVELGGNGGNAFLIAAGGNTWGGNGGAPGNGGPTPPAIGSVSTGGAGPYQYGQGGGGGLWGGGGAGGYQGFGDLWY